MSAGAGLTIGEVAERTGVAQGTLRMWEQRYGFPEPQRLAGGHRRYSDRDVEAIAAVEDARRAGLSLRAAIERARAGRAEPEESVFAGLRRRRPDLSPYLLPKHTLVGLSHAIEDECCARAEHPLLFGAFQRVRFYRDAESRWRELARTARLAVVFADFDRRRDPEGAPVELPLERSAPLGREWALVCEADDYAACLAAWERPGQERVRDCERLFETVWSVDPVLVRDGARIAAGLAGRAAPDVAARAEPHLDGPPAASRDPVALVAALSARMVAYVGAAELNRVPAPHAGAPA